MSGDSSWEDPAEAQDGMDVETPSEIQGLLDEGYEQLDAFVQWLEETLGLDVRTAQQDCFNAEMLIDYLANSQRKSSSEINEFELRWFLFSHYIRKAMADAETEERLLDSLRRFYEFLRSEYAYDTPDWLYATLDDRAFYLKRRRDYLDLQSEEEKAWQRGFRAWCDELETELDARCLWLPREMGEGMLWGDTAGWREATLQEEANRLWQEERSELLWQGLDFDSIRERLEDSYLLWLDTPQSRLEDRTPREIIEEERVERAEEAEPEEDDAEEDED